MGIILGGKGASPASAILCLALAISVAGCGQVSATSLHTGPATSTPKETAAFSATPTGAPVDVPTASGILCGTSSEPGSTEAVFPLGFMGLADEEAFGEVVAAGFNVVHEFRSIQEVRDAELYLERAEVAGLKVVQNMPSCRAYESGHPVCEEWNGGVWSEQEWAVFISTLAKHRNLIAWFLPDELADYEVADDLYGWVKEYDPQQRPVYGNPGTFGRPELARFVGSVDFLWAACYPDYYAEPRVIVTYGMGQDAAVCQGTGTRWGAVLQFFDSAQFGRQRGYPTPRQLRADSYQAVIAGASGLWFFGYEMGRHLPGLWEAASQVADEINGTGGLAKVLLSPEVPQTIGKTVVSGPKHSPQVQGQVYDAVQTLQKDMHGTYLFAVNVAASAVTVEFSDLRPEVIAVEVMFEGRTIPVVGGSFQDHFAEDDVHIYRSVVGG